MLMIKMMMMKCIHYHNPPFPGLTKLSHKQTLKIEKFTWLSANGNADTATATATQEHKFRPTTRTNAMPITSTHHLLLVVNSPATTGDYKVLLVTSAALLFLYWIVNFVVPEFIMKGLQSEETSKDQEAKNNRGSSFWDDK